VQYAVSSETCSQIDQHSIELYVMGRLPGSSVREHLDTCTFCRESVDEYRSYISLVKRALHDLQQSGAPYSDRKALDTLRSPDE
jgi:hypothetical protein